MNRVLQKNKRYSPAKTNIFNDVFDSHAFISPANSLAQVLINEIANNRVHFNVDGSTDSSFFEHLADTYKYNFYKSFQIDADSFEVHTRQMMILLKHSGIVEGTGNTYSISKALNPLSTCLLSSLFNTFWNKVRWSLLFPSMPSVAEEMQSAKREILSLAKEYEYSFYIDDYAGDLLLITGISSTNHFLFTSFLDFSVFRWFYFFGLVEYTVTKQSRIRISMTPLYQKFLSRI